MTPHELAAEVPDELRAEVADTLWRILSATPDDGSPRREAVASVAADLDAPRGGRASGSRGRRARWHP